MTPSQRRDLIYQVAGFVALGLFFAYEARRHAISWWVLPVGILIATLLGYVRYRYWIPAIDEVQERKKGAKKSTKIPA